jgi:hypothetical protein
MVDLERLTKRARRAYELGRIRRALWVIAFIAPIGALCVLLSPRKGECLCLLVVLLAFVIGMRWHGRRAGGNASVGLIAGALPLAAGILLALEPSICGGPGCILGASLVALVAGVWIAWRLRHESESLDGYLAVAGIAVLSASVGCIALGLIGVLGVVIGIALGSGAGALVLSTR